jgi:BED zinc finger
MSGSDSNEIQHENLNVIVKKKRGGSQKKSWVWEWFGSDETGAICQVEITTGQICNKHYKNGSSTGNLISHLANKHQITEGLKKQDFVVSEFIIWLFFEFIG